MAFQVPITIKEAIENIDNNKYLLPSIQREFVWEHTNIEWLFDSIMRDYPISCFLFWQVEGATKKDYRFYKFLNEYREDFKTHNIEISTNGLNDFLAVLDGQQRLTALYLGLKGSYAYRGHGKAKRKNDENTRPTRHLYLNITKELIDEESGRIYEFKFLNKKDTKEQTVYQSNDIQWFKVGAILDYVKEEDFDDFVEDLESSFARKAVRRLRRTILEKTLINYFLEKEQDFQKALNIFIRINSGGEPLSLSDIIMSIAVANWGKDARKEIHNLTDAINEKGFRISKDLILKVFLYLYSKDIKFKVKNFSTDNAKEFENSWDKIRDAMLETFELIKKFGFTDHSLTSKNAVIPIIYYLYHKDIYRDFSTKIKYAEDRDIIKKWLHIVLIKTVFGSSSDTVLAQVRNAFTNDFETVKINDEIINFPSDEIFRKIKRDTSLSDEFIEELLCVEKDNKYAFSILSLLYPHLDYKNNDFHKDHLHPYSKFSKKNINSLNIEGEIKDEYFSNKCVYNGIYNLQMLDSNENMSKNDMDLKDWVDKETKNRDREQFLDAHLIPDVDLSFENFKEFIDEREKLLMKKLKNILK